jgi:hypothetical protein
MKSPFFVIFSVLISAVSAVSCVNSPAGNAGPAAVEGVIDLRGWNLATDGPLRLDGEWEFCRNRLYGSQDFTEDKKPADCGFAPVPGLWIEHAENSGNTPGEGSATYRLKLINGSDRRMKQMSTRKIFSMYKLMVNGVKVDKSGSADRSANIEEDYIFVHNVRRSTFQLKEGVNELILQVSNKNYKSGGIGRSLIIEDAETAEKEIFYKHSLEMIVAGLLMFAFIYNIILYFFRREDKAPLYFGLFCFLMAVNTFNHQFPILSGRLAYPGNPYFLNYLTVILAVQTALMAIRSFFPDEFSKYAARFYFALACVFITVILTAGFRTAERLMTVYFVFVIVFIIYDIYVFAKAVINRRDDALLFLAGFTPLFAGTINDALYAMWIINTANIVQYAVIILCVVIIAVISRRFSRVLNDVKQLSDDHPAGSGLFEGKSAAPGFTLRAGGSTYTIKFSSIVYVTSRAKRIVIHSTDGDIEVPVLIKEIADRLSPDDFIRIHKSHIINLNYLRSLHHVVSGRYRVRLRDEDDTELPVGSAYLDILRKKIQI